MRGVYTVRGARGCLSSIPSLPLAAQLVGQRCRRNGEASARKEGMQAQGSGRQAGERPPEEEFEVQVKKSQPTAKQLPSCPQSAVLPASPSLACRE